MMFTKAKLIMCLGVLSAIFATSVTAQTIEVTGKLQATIDGSEREWFVTQGMFDGEMRSQSDFSGGVSSGYLSVSIFGHASDKSILGSANALAVSFDSYNASDLSNIDLPEIAFRAKGKSGGLYSSSNDGTAAIELDSLDLRDGKLHATGSFEGTLPYRNFTSREPDVNDVVTVENGSFDVILRPRE